MQTKLAVLSLVIIALVLTSPKYTQTASSKSSYRAPARLRAEGVNPALAPAFVTTLSVDRTDDVAAASACTAAPNDCSLRGAVRKANTAPGPEPVVISLLPATTYNLTLSNANQENAAATGDLDITTSQHPVTIEGGGSTTIIDATGLNAGARRDRVFHVTGSNVTVILRELTIRNGQAGDDGTAGTSTNPTAQNTTRIGGGILNNSGRITLERVTVQSCQAIGKGDSIVNEHTTLDAFGGGLASVAANANVTITDSTFTGNTASGGNGGNFNNGAGSNVKGGSIYFEGGTLVIDGSRVLLSIAIGGNGGNGPGNQQNGGMGGMAHGGCAYIGGGNVSINDSTFKSCSATGGNSGTGQNGTNNGADSGGGALFSLGNVKVTNSTFALNIATGGNSGDSFGPDCFGAHMSGDGGAARGGAILADGGSLIINTATFAGNSAKGGHGGDGGKTNGGSPCAQTSHGAGGLAHGGALTNNNAATLNINHATISLNEARAGNTGVNQAGANLPPRPRAEGTGGGIRVGTAGVTLENTIIANNTAANGLGDPAGAPTPGPNVDGTVTSNGHNLLGVSTEAGGFGGAGDKINANPMLAALANNGGPTETMALQAGSAAIDAGVAAGATTDQRGLPRTFNDPGVANAPTSDGTDIGAFERQPRQSRCDLCCPNNITVPSDRGRRGAIVKYEMPEAKGCGRVKCVPPSGSFFPLGETIVTCYTEAGPECSFKVTVKGPQISNPKE
ncbi:MAG TPA: choice-of-anchor Q domain-containing protein [Pyrinomonadaceae bacterium]|nr:choice-of-anchor Q domain-containing protein [Pyrinomonadaceae bacterium]